MYIIAIGWAYVIVLMSLTENSIVAGVATFVFYGLIPISLILWLGGAKARRQRRLLADQRARQSDGTDTQADQ